jgi:ribonuclease HII
LPSGGRVGEARAVPDSPRPKRRRLVLDADVAGVDEAGRGPLAGPVAVAAVLLDPRRVPRGLDDSKKLDRETRERLFGEIVAKARASAIIFAPVAEIDQLNIRRATLAAMCRAVAALAIRPAAAVIDGVDVPEGLVCPGTAIIEADGSHAAVAAASILAKVARDRAMAALGRLYPAYGFERHMGYATPEHMAAIERLGPCPHHRMSFAPMRQGRLDLALTGS